MGAHRLIIGQLRLYLLGQLLSQLNTPLIKAEDIQMTPCTKILCSYMAMRLPSVLGVSSLNRMELVGLFPSKTL
jgi:hypothetical protein